MVAALLPAREEQGSDPTDSVAPFFAPSFNPPHASQNLRSASRRFLGAFLRLEVGETTPRIRKTIRATAAADFSAQLLGQPTHRHGATGAHLTRLQLVRIPGSPPRALLTGSARRDHATEEFSFLAELRAGRWQIAGPGE